MLINSGSKGKKSHTEKWTLYNLLKQAIKLNFKVCYIIIWATLLYDYCFIIENYLSEKKYQLYDI